MHALTLLINDHKKVEALFKQFERLGEGKAEKKKQVVSKIIRELSIHAAIEEMLFYPAVRKAVKQADDEVLEALEEHHIVKWTLSELERMSPEAERYDAKVTVLTELVRHHVKEEQNDLFPKVRKKMDRKTLEALGTAMEKAKRTAPTRPHPRAPDEPPGVIAAGLGAGLIDRARDMVKNAMKKGTKKAVPRANGKMKSVRPQAAAH